MATHGVAGDSSSYEEIMQTCISKLYEHTSETLRKEDSTAESGNASDTCYGHVNAKEGQSSSANASFRHSALSGMHFPEDSEDMCGLATDLEELVKLKRDFTAKEFTSFEKAVQDIKDTSIPVKGHGLIALGKLLSSRDKETLCYRKELLSIFQVS